MTQSDPAFSPISEILEDLRAGRMVILVDDEERENEGDLVCAAVHAWSAGRLYPSSTVFAALADGGQVQMPIAETFWAHRWGALTDRYGKPWMVNCMKPMP